MEGTIGVLAHALDPRDLAWESLIWGSPAAGLLGRAAKAIEIAFALDAKLLVFPGGAWPNSGVEKSSVYTYAHIRAHAGELAGVLGMSESDMLAQLERIVLLEETALTTRDEIEKVGALFVQHGITQPVQVSSPFHILRAHQLSMDIWKQPAYQTLHNPWATASDTNLADMRPTDTLVFEPGHPHYKEAKTLMTI